MTRLERIQTIVLVVVAIWLIVWTLTPLNNSALDDPGLRATGETQ